jgi:hypothetical protein
MLLKLLMSFLALILPVLIGWRLDASWGGSDRIGQR